MYTGFHIPEIPLLIPMGNVNHVGQVALLSLFASEGSSTRYIFVHTIPDSQDFGMILMMGNVDYLRLIALISGSTTYANQTQYE